MPDISATVRAQALVAALSLAALTACGGTRPTDTGRGQPGPEPGGLVLTRAEIEQLGARDAMEAVERAPTHLYIQRVRNGDAARITQRGIGSFVLNPEILVVVDGTRVSHAVRYLEMIPAESIRFIQILSAREAVVKWGSEAGNGAILVITSARQY